MGVRPRSLEPLVSGALALISCDGSGDLFPAESPGISAQGLGEAGCATVPYDAKITLPSQPYAAQWTTISPDNSYGHGSACPDQFVVEVENLSGKTYWMAGNTGSPWPETEFWCDGLRVEVGTYKYTCAAGFCAWSSRYDYVITGRWMQDSWGYWRCDTIYTPGPPPISGPGYSKVRVAVKASSWFGAKYLAEGGIIFN